jgi:hypothetical protein
MIPRPVLEEEIERRLNEWGRWARGGLGWGPEACRSAERQYDAPAAKIFDSEHPGPRVDELAAQQIEDHWRGLLDLHRFILRAHFVGSPRGWEKNIHRTARKFGVPISAWAQYVETAAGALALSFDSPYPPARCLSNSHRAGEHESTKAALWARVKWAA